MTVRCANPQTGYGVNCTARTLWDPCTDAYKFWTALDFGGRGRTGKKTFHGRGHRVGMHAFDSSICAVDDNIERVAGKHDTALHIDYARDLADGLGNNGRSLLEQGTIIRIKFDFDRLRNSREIADQVFHQLRHFNFETRHLLFYFFANVVDDLVDRPSWLWFQPYKKIAFIRFCDASAQLEAGASGVGIDLGCILQNLFHLTEEPVSFAQRCSGFSTVIQNETAFIHRGHEAGAHIFVAKKSDHQQRNDAEQDKKRTHQHLLQKTAVPMVHVLSKSPAFLLVGIFFTEKFVGQNRNGERRDEK